MNIEHFEAAKLIALTIGAGNSRRARVNDVPVNYTGYEDLQGRYWVICDSYEDYYGAHDVIGHPVNPIKLIMKGKPCIQVYKPGI